MSESEDGLMVRVAWLYYVGGFNQEATASRLGLTRARVNKILGEARESGLVSISIDHQNAGTLPVENELMRRYGLNFCVSTPPFGFDMADDTASEIRKQVSFRAVGVAAATYLKNFLADNQEATVGTGWGEPLSR